MNIWKGNIDSLLKSSSNSWIKFPRDIASSKYQYSIIIISNTLHLYEELSFNSSASFIFTLTSTSTKWIYLIYEYNSWFILSS